MTDTYLKLASYNYKRAAYHAATGCPLRANKCLEAARQYDGWAQAESK